MSKRYFEVVNSGDAGVGKIKIYGVLSSWYDDVNAVDFLAAFNALEATCNRINIHINSPGGSVYEGLPIANAIKASKVDVHTYVDGVAFSMAGIITIAAPKGNVHMAKGSLLMLHSASSYAYGNSEKLKKQADDLSKYDDVLASFVESRLNLSAEEVKSDFFDGEDHFFTAKEAKEEGLVDVLEDYDVSDTPDDVENMSLSEVAAWYQGATLPKKVNNSDKENNMLNKYRKLSALAKVAVADITAEMLDDVNAQIQESGVNGVTVVATADLEAQDSKVEGLEADKTALNAKVTTLESSVTAKDARIAELEGEVKALGGKPANTPGTPTSEGDKTPSGSGDEKVVDEFETSVDREAKAMWG